MNAPHDDHDLEESLTRTFATASDGFAPQDDWDDLAGRIRRSDRTRRFAAVALAVVVIGAATTGGYVGGEDQGRRGTDETEQRGAPQPEPSGPATFDADSTQEPRVPSGDEIAFRRTTRDGSEMRVWTRPNATAPSRLSPPCQLAGYVRVELSTADAVSVQLVTLPPRPVPRAVLLTTREQRPTPMIVAVQALDARNVTVRFPDGSTDSMTPVRGLAVLSGGTVDPLDPAASGDQPIPTAAITAIVDGIDGTTRSVPMILASALGSGWIDSGCTPLLRIGQQPSDVATARAAVMAAFGDVYDVSVPNKPWGDLIDDASRLEELFAQARSGPGAELVAHLTFRLDELAFSAPDHAAFTFTLFSVTGALPNQYGEARFVDGRWKVTRATVCSSLGIVSVSCDPAGPR